MATTGLWPVKSRLKEVIAYADNPDKTSNPKYADSDLYSVIKYAENDDKTDQQLFVSTINCPRQRPYECMMATKRRFGKTNGIVAYHGFQSFRQGEVTPEEAHQIGIETAKRMWGDKYEVVITTHLDHESHYHNHFVANSVSRLDGTRFQNHHYDHLHLREISDAVCLEYGKSVLKDSTFWGHKKGEYWAHKNGKMTHRDMVRADIENALQYCENPDDLYKQLKSIGYTISKPGEGKHITIIAPGWQRPLRLDTLGFTKEYINSRLRENRDDYYFYDFKLEHPPYRPRKFPLEWEATRLAFTIEHSHDTATVMVDLLFLLIIEVFRLLSEVSDVILLSADLRHEVRNVKQFISDHHFLESENIHTMKDLEGYISKTEADIAELEHKRQLADNKRRRASPEEKQQYKDERKAITEHVTLLRKKLRTAKDIYEKSPRLYDLVKTELALEKEAREYPKTKTKENDKGAR